MPHTPGRGAPPRATRHGWPEPNLGLEVEGTGAVEGEFVEAVCGIPGAQCEIAMLRPPDGGSRLELVSFVTPEHVPGSPTAMANELGPTASSCPLFEQIG